MKILKPLLTGLWITLAATPLTAAASIEKQWNFTVFLDDKEIGYHRFEMDRQGEMQNITIEARFKVRFFGIPMYSYAHDNLEISDGRCLQKITAVTDDNGKQFRVDGKADGGDFSLQTLQEKQVLPGCVSTFTYWDKAFLENDRLLNAQTGEYLDVTSTFQGKEMLDTGSNKIPALRYRLVNKAFNIDIWYSEKNEWLGLESTTKGGRKLRYVIE